MSPVPRKTTLALFAAVFLLMACLSQSAGGASGGACPSVLSIARRNVTEADIQTSLALLQVARAAWEAGRTGKGGLGGEGAREVLVEKVVAACCEALLALPNYARRLVLGVAFRAEGDAWQAVRVLKEAHRAEPAFAPPLYLLEQLLDLDLTGDDAHQWRGLIPAEVLDDGFGLALRRLAALPQVESILEVGSSGGAGSTAALLSGIYRRVEGGMAVEMHCIEVSRVRVQRLRTRLAEVRHFTPVVHHAVSVPPSACLSAHQVRAFGSLRSQLPEEDRAAFDRLWNQPAVAHPSGGAGAGAGGTELENLARGAEDKVAGERAFLAEAGVDMAGPGGIVEALRCASPFDPASPTHAVLLFSSG